MRKRAIIGTAAAAAIAAGAAIVPLTASAHAAPEVKKHVYSFISVTKANVNFSKTDGGGTEYDTNAKGKVIGFDLTYYSYNPKTNTATISAVGELPGGFIYVSGPASDSPVTKGKVTGGSGAFKGATGTFVAKNLNKAGTKTAVTITYYI